VTDPSRAHAALSAADVGVWDWTVSTGELAWDATIARLHGVDLDAFDGTMESFLARVHPDDLEGLEHAIETAVGAGGSFMTEFRVVWPDGDTRWIQGRGAALTGSDGRTVRMLGLGMDTTELRSQRERAGRSIELATDGLVIIERDWTISYVNPAAGRILGRDPAAVLGVNFWDSFPDADGTVFWQELHNSAAKLEPTRFRVHDPRLDAWFELQVFPAPDGLTVFFNNVGEEVQAEEQRENLLVALETAVERGHQLHEITARLADAITVADVARTILVSTRRTLDTQYAGIALNDESGRFLEFEEVDVLPDSTRSEWGRVPLGADTPITIASRTGKRFFHESSDELLAEFPGLRDTMALVGQGAFANVPLVSGGRPFGVLAVSWPAPRALSESDRAFLVTVAGQCAQAIERARVFERERSTARMLQRAILPELRDPFGSVRCTARYLPAESGIEVGGDWYDAFRVTDGALAIVIGDVAGHGLQAAATMGQLRNMLRAYAFEDASPATVLERLDTILAETGSEQFATCFYARYEPQTRVLSFANAGHPPPVVLTPQSPAALLAAPPSPLLGARGTTFATSVRLEPGTRMLLFTDGLIERRSQPVDDGLDRLVACLREGAPADLDDLCDYVLTNCTDKQSEDDVCLLAVDFGGHRRRRAGRRRRSSRVRSL